MPRHTGRLQSEPTSATPPFFATLKKELVHHEHYETRAQARQSLFEYIEVFYNRTRSHSAPGFVSPAQFAEAL